MTGLYLVGAVVCFVTAAVLVAVAFTPKRHDLESERPPDA